MPLTAEQTQLTKIKQKRILKEIKEIQQTPIDPDNSVYEYLQDVMFVLMMKI